MSDDPVELVKVGRRFGEARILEGIDLAVQPGEFVAMVGASGVGKTTLLNLLSGHDHPSSGHVVRRLPVRMVYQQDGLFPWLTASQNITMGLRHLDDRTRRQELDDLLALIGLSDFGDHYPHQLSRGMRQRVELARALTGKTQTLMLDEPFSALDYLTRLRLREELVRILSKRPHTVVLVTHDIEEAAQLADRVIVLAGRPAAIRTELRVSLPRPRPPTHPAVVETVAKILEELRNET